MIRRAAPGDESALHALAAATFPLACPPGSLPADQQRFIDTHLSTEAFASYLADPHRALFVDEDPSDTRRVIGYTMVVFTPPTDDDVRTALAGGPAPTAELSKCYALPAAHGSGRAARLVAASIDEARSRGSARMWLGVNEENRRAQKFYAKQGFAVVGTKRFLVGTTWEHDLVLARDLTPPDAQSRADRS